MKAIFRVLSIALLAVLVYLAGCKPEQGDPGPKGNDGTNGTNGTNGEAYDQAVSLGGIKILFTGQTPYGDPFSDTVNFKYSTTDLDYSYVYHYSTTDLYWYLRRWDGLTYYQAESYADIYYEEDSEAGYQYLDMDVNVDISSEDFKYFEVSDFFYYGEGSNIDNPDFSEVTYDPNTGKVQYDLAFTVPANNNETQYDLDVHVFVDATVYEYLYSGGGRIAGDHRFKGGKSAGRIKLNVHR